MKIGEPYNPRNLFVGVYIPSGIVEHPHLTPGAKLCFGRLCQFAGENGYCWPRQETLCAGLACSKRQAQRYVDELISARLIDVQQRGLNRSNVYVFLWHDSLECSLRAAPPMPPITKLKKPKDVTYMSTPKVTHVSTQDTTHMSTPSIEVDSFEEIRCTCNECGDTGWRIQQKVVRGIAANHRVPCNCTDAAAK